MDLLVFSQVGGVQQVFVNGAGAFIIELAVGDGGAVDFGFKEGSEHGENKLRSTRNRLRSHGWQVMFSRACNILALPRNIDIV